MNCRLCAKDITASNGLLLYDYDDNIETRLGRKINTILSGSGDDEKMSNYCCKCCSSKVKVCFSLLVEIKAADEVIREAYKNLSNKEIINMSNQVFQCQECDIDIPGISCFIKHHESHVLSETISGTKKDVALSSISPIENKTDKSKKIKKKDTVSSKESTIGDNVGLNENHEPNEINLLDEIHGNNKHMASSYIKSSDNVFEENELLQNYEFSETCESYSDNESEAMNNSYIIDNLYSGSDESDVSDIQSECSFKSDSSYKNLIEIVKAELEKSDDDDEEGNTSTGLKLLPNNDGYYSCDVCNITFKYKFILLLHLKRNHTAYHEYDVTLQGEKLNISENENEAYLNCWYRKNTLDFKNNYVECEEQFSHDTMTLCQVCGKMFSPKTIGKHVEEHKKTENWTCELCGKKFKAKRFLESHLGEHDESKKKICEICGKKLLPLSFFSHIIKHREKRHVCPYCGKAFTYNHGLRLHLKVHDASKKLDLKPDKKQLDKVFCWLCKKDFNCTIALNKHLKCEHNAENVEQDSRFPCSQCEKKFADMFSLKAHLKLIHELKDEEIARLKSLPVYRYIECNVCNKVFNSENKVRIHMKQDHGLKPFEMEILKKECEKCGKKFASKQNLIHHINGAHLHIKPMTCDICHEKFAKHSSLIYHKLRHSGEKPFQCEFCHKSYRQRNDVIRHLARHVRDKELTLEEASAVNNSPSRLVIKRRIFLKDSSINYRTILNKNRRKSEPTEMEPILEEAENEIQEEQMEFNEDEITNMIYVEEIPVEENVPDSPEIHSMNAKPVYDEERNTIILSNPETVLSSVKCKYIPAHLKHLPAVVVKKQEQI